MIKSEIPERSLSQAISTDYTVIPIFFRITTERLNFNLNPVDLFTVGGIYEKYTGG